MKALKYIFLLTTVSLWGCKKEVGNISHSASATQTVDDLQFILETTDMNGQPKSVFARGENFKLTLLIKNKSSKEITLCHCFLTDANPNLLAVYAAEKIDPGPKIGIIEPGDSIGKPWNGSGGYMIAPITRISANSYIKYSLPWIPDTTVKYRAPEPSGYLGFNPIQNPWLSSGKYYTKFDFKYLDKDIHLKCYFTIQ